MDVMEVPKVGEDHHRIAMAAKAHHKKDVEVRQQSISALKEAAMLAVHAFPVRLCVAWMLTTAVVLSRPWFCSG